MKAYIKRDVDIYTDHDEKELLWLFTEDKKISSEVKKILAMFEYEGIEGGFAYPILEDEIEAIRDACNEYLERKNK